MSYSFNDPVLYSSRGQMASVGGGFVFNNPVAYSSSGNMSGTISSALTILSVQTAEGLGYAPAGTRIFISCLNAGTEGLALLGKLSLYDLSWSENLVSGVIQQGMVLGVHSLYLVTSDARSAFLGGAFTVMSPNMDPESQFLTSLKTKLENSNYITDTSNVFMGIESVDITDLPDEAFPRYEVLITKDKMDGYASQRNADFSFRYEVAGYLKRGVEDITFEDLKRMTAFAMETRRLMYSFNDDKQNGRSPCTGFLFMGQFTEVFYDFELVGKIGTFLLQMEAHIQLSDTEV